MYTNFILDLIDQMWFELVGLLVIIAGKVVFDRVFKRGTGFKAKSAGKFIFEKGSRTKQEQFADKDKKKAAIRRARWQRGVDDRTPRTKNPIVAKILINRRLLSAPDANSILSLVQRHSDEFNSVNFCTAMSRLAKNSNAADLARDRRFTDLLQQLEHELVNFDSRALANLAWSLCKTVPQDRALFNKLAEQCMGKLDQFNPQALSTLLYSFGKAGHANRRLFLAVAEFACKVPSEFVAQQLANTVWAFATANISNPKLFDIAARQTIQRLSDPLTAKEFTTQELAMTVWSFAKLGVHNEQLFSTVGERLLPMLPMCSSQQLCNSLWAFAKLNIPAPVLFDDAVQYILPKLEHDFTAQNLANAAWAYATARHHVPSLLAALGKYAGLRVEEFNTQELANTMWSLVQLEFDEPRLMERLAQSCLTKLDQFEAHSLANTLALLAKVHPPLLSPSLFDTLAWRGAARLDQLVEEENNKPEARRAPEGYRKWWSHAGRLAVQKTAEHGQPARSLVQQPAGCE